MRYYCSKCGSMKIEAKAFVPINKRTIPQRVEEPLNFDDKEGWCNNCDFTRIVSLDKLSNQYLKSKNLFAKNKLAKDWHWFKKGTSKESIKKWLDNQKEEDEKDRLEDEFNVIGVSRHDLMEKEFDAKNLTDEQMKLLAKKLSDIIIGDSFWEDLTDAGNKMNIPCVE